MKKNAILIFIIVLIALTYNSLTKEEKTAKQELKDKNTIEYRIEEEQNLITDEKPITNSTKDNVEFTNYIETVNSDITTITNKQELTPLDKETLKNTFITLTDFIFYNGEIKGTTFNELTTTAKEKVISIYENIDAKIESVYPGYKEMIKDTSIKTYNNIKEKIVDLKDQIQTNYKNEIGEDRYNAQVETFNEGKENMIESFDPIIDKTVEEAKNIYNETIENLDKWYKNWKEENN